MIDGLSSSPFSAVTLPPIPHPDISYVKEIIASSREQFAKPQAEVEAEIIKFHEAVITTKKDSKPKDDSKSAVKSEAKPDQGGAKAPQSAPSPLGEKLAAVQAEQKLSSSAVEPKNVEPVPASTQKMAENPAATKKPTFAELVKAAQDAAHGEVRNKSVALPHKPSPADKAAPVLSGKPPESVDPQVGSRSKLQEQSQPKSSDQSQPQASPQPEIKPVPLSALTKQPVKSDPKVPTPKNVNDLKNALAAVLAKNKPVPKETDKPPIDSANTSKAVKSENIETKAPDLDTAKASGKKSSESKSASTKDAATSIPESAQEKKEI